MQRETVADEAAEAAEEAEDHFRRIWAKGTITPEEAQEQMRRHRETVAKCARSADAVRRGVRTLRRGGELPPGP
jgi:hypothetical protein